MIYCLLQNNSITLASVRFTLNLRSRARDTDARPSDRPGAMGQTFPIFFKFKDRENRPFRERSARKLSDHKFGMRDCALLTMIALNLPPVPRANVLNRVPKTL